MQMKFLALILIYFTSNLYELCSMEVEINDYINVVLTYYRARQVKILTHFTCFSQSE